MQLGKIDKIVIDLNSDIVKVNEKVKALVEELAARGEATSHLLNSLFDGYKVASDKNFLVSYIKKKKEEYNDSSTPIEPDTLMYQASNYYVASVEAEEWERPSHEEQQIIALEAQIKQLEANVASYASNVSQPGTPRNKNSPGNARNVKPAWMLEPPKSGDHQKKTVNGKEYHWCPKHQAWVRHLPSECEGKGIKPSESQPAHSSNPAPHEDSGPKQIKLSNALTAVLEQDDEDADTFP